MSFKISSISKSCKVNLSLGNHNLNLNGQWIKTMMFHQDSSADSLGKMTTLNLNALLELSIGSGSTLMNMLVIPYVWSLLHLLIDVILL